MNNNKPTSVTYHRKHREEHQNRATRLEGVVKSKGIKPVHKEKKDRAPK